MGRGGQKPTIHRMDRIQLVIILLIALIHGLIYVFLVPPWQHYDEPNHFEYAWLVANHNALPHVGDKDQALNYAIFASLIENDFFAWMEEPPVLGQPEDPIELPGYPQLSEPPLYYFLASIPLRIIHGSAIEIQLYAARLTSLILFLIVILAGWGTLIELTKPGHPLRWMAPLALAFLPGLVDIMTAVNSDAGAIALGSLFFWGSTRLIRRGLSLFDFLWVTTTAGLSYYTKNIAIFTILLLPMVLIFSIMRGRFRWIAWVSVACGILLLVASSLVFSDAAFWYRATSQKSGTRERGNPAVLGDYILAIDLQAPAIPNGFPPVFQSMPVELVEALRGKDVSFGFWIWADQPLEARLPIFDSQGVTVMQDALIGPNPQFLGYQVKIPDNARRIWIDLNPGLAGTEQGQVFIDSMVLAEGVYPQNEAPQFANIHGSYGNWGGQTFTNLLRNPSFETVAPRIRSDIDDLGAVILPNQARPSLVLMYFMDWVGMQEFLKISIDRLHRTFWAEFGWGNVSLQEQTMYVMLGVVGLLAMIAALIGAIRQRRIMPWEVIFILVLAIILSWSTTLSRSFGFMVQYKFYVPVARHTYPSIVPVMTLLTFGWLEIFRWVIAAFGGGIWKTKQLPAQQSLEVTGLKIWIPMILYSIPWIALAILALNSINNFYYT